ncbi:hypothetical protein C4D60_Mb11t09670 [Musa balbisiana]|uniref:Uncharacterized protein n=1 Tax=Musa balbisiana TaxID=52838 RepID=A0A4S8J2Y3_MUSBA|nr:hypothetical protein C4D60_Mb11t09670 [Musa balbisiana]
MEGDGSAAPEGGIAAELRKCSSSRSARFLKELALLRMS